jgi:ArsR family metal-binding transcriptional regulator
VAVCRTVLVFPNEGERDQARAVLQVAGQEVRVFQVPAGLVGVGIAAIHFPSEEEAAILHLLGRQNVIVGGTCEFDPAQVVGAASVCLPEGAGTEGDAALLERINLTMVLPCIADYRKIRIRAQMSHDVSAVLPYLNGLLPRATYNAAGQTFTFTAGERLITLYPRRVEMAKAEDVLDALRTLAWLREWINETWANRASLTPSYEKRMRPHALQVYPYLPAAQHNCRQCGEQTCLAFAVKVVNEMEGQVIGNCWPLREVWEYETQREIVYDLLRAAGYETPGGSRQS